MPLTSLFQPLAATVFLSIDTSATPKVSSLQGSQRYAFDSTPYDMDKTVSPSYV